MRCVWCTVPSSGWAASGSGAVESVVCLGGGPPLLLSHRDTSGSGLSSRRLLGSCLRAGSDASGDTACGALASADSWSMRAQYALAWSVFCEDRSTPFHRSACRSLRAWKFPAAQSWWQSTVMSAPVPCLCHAVCPPPRRHPAVDAALPRPGPRRVASRQHTPRVSAAPRRTAAEGRCSQSVRGTLVPPARAAARPARPRRTRTPCTRHRFPSLRRRNTTTLHDALGRAPPQSTPCNFSLAFEGDGRG